MKLTDEQKQANKLARQEARKAAKEVARVEGERNQPPVKSIDINIEWRKSRIWGSNPFVDAYIAFKDGTGERATATASGCGYDKESTVVGDIFNRFLKYKLWQLDESKVKNSGRLGDSWENKLPYGIHFYEYGGKKSWGYGQGAGMSCYPKIAEAIGGKLEHIASGKTFDVWKYTDNSNT